MARRRAVPDLELLVLVRQLPLQLLWYPTQSRIRPPFCSMRSVPDQTLFFSLSSVQQTLCLRTTHIQVWVFVCVSMCVRVVFAWWSCVCVVFMCASAVPRPSPSAPGGIPPAPAHPRAHPRVSARRTESQQHSLPTP
eukprot:1119891-Rhodomonas_salina.3